MTKPEPLQYGQHYHIYNRGNSGEILFREERNYPYFLELYAKYIEPVAETYAYCLVSNHFHLLVRIKDFEECEEVCQAGNLQLLDDWQTYSHVYPSRAFSNLFSTYTKAFNKSHGRTGSLFEKPFRRKLVDSDRYFTALVAYIHRNPQKHGLVADFRAWPHSSYQAILSDRPTRVQRDAVLEWFDGRIGFEELHLTEVDEAVIGPLVVGDLEQFRSARPATCSCLRTGRPMEMILLKQSNVLPAHLPSWNEGASKESILRFVEAVTAEGGAKFVQPLDRIAVFDNDGTLWSEKPFYFQLAFALDRVKDLAPEHPEWQEQQPFKAVLEDDFEGLLAGGMKAILDVLVATHGGDTTEEFEATVSDWIASARHPETGRLYTEMVYQPMLELLDYLRTNGFRTYIVSGGGIEFMRAWVEDLYGIPPEQVIGSTIETRFEMRDSGPVLVRIPKVDFVDDNEGKPVGIHKFIGRRPILAFGNSDGDHQMLQWTAAGDGARLMGLVHHTDAEREWAYDRESHVGRLDKALDEAREKGWTVVDMAREWRVVYPWESDNKG